MVWGSAWRETCVRVPHARTRDTRSHPAPGRNLRPRSLPSVIIPLLVTFSADGCKLSSPSFSCSLVIRLTKDG